jgi:hypothetical protein
MEEATDIIMQSLVAKARNEDYDEHRASVAACFLVAAELVSKGVEVDTAMNAVEQALSHGDIEITWSPDDGLTTVLGERA